MANGWMGINTALSGLQAAQQSLDIAAHNIANAGTPGYSRQRAQLVASPPFSMPAFNRSGLPGQLGTGVTVSSIYRIRDAFLDSQINVQVSAAGYWNARSSTLAQVESVFPEPSGSGLGTVLSRFWGAWEDVAADPGSTAARMSVIAETETLAVRFGRDAVQLDTLIASADGKVRDIVGQVNDLASRVAQLNKQIQEVTIGGNRANDLEDQRDQLLEQLASLIPTQNMRQPDGTVTVVVAGTDLVNHAEVRTITLADNASGHAIPTWSTGGAVEVNGGQLKGYLELRDVTLAGYKNELNTLAKAIADAVNAAHTSGFDVNGNPGLPLFVYTAGNEAGTLALNPAIGQDPSRIVAAGAPGQPGDSSVAAMIASYANTSIFGPGGQSATDAYASFIARIGINARQANEMADNQSFIVAQMQIRRESISGVSLDEEATDVMRFQQAYSACARVITAIDQMLETLIKGTGVVGR